MHDGSLPSLEQAVRHESQGLSDAAVAELAVEEAVHLLVLRRRDPRRVRLVEEGDPERVDAVVVDDACEEVGELRHVRQRERDAAPLPGDVDPRAGALREHHGPVEGVHPIRVRPLGRVEEDADELRLQPVDQRVVRCDVGRRPTDAGVDVLVQLPAEADEAAHDAAVRGERELRRLRLGSRLADGREAAGEETRDESGADDTQATASRQPRPPVTIVGSPTTEALREHRGKHARAAVTRYGRP
jgi:hypothetical protein